MRHGKFHSSHCEKYSILGAKEKGAGRAEEMIQKQLNAEKCKKNLLMHCRKVRFQMKLCQGTEKLLMSRGHRQRGQQTDRAD